MPRMMGASDHTTEQEERLMAVRLAEYLRAHPGVQLSLSGYNAWSLMAALQLVCRHPDLPRSLHARLTQLGHTLQGSFASDPWVADIAEGGWNPERDIPRDVPRDVPDTAGVPDVHDGGAP